ncbi:MAG: hypothetical protein JNK04_03250 [Myxococcales bacterium]|nr:hypothetical protein [Myxococcales bacterium]
MATALASMKALFRLHKSQRTSRLDELLQFAPAGGSQAEHVLWLVEWMRWMRERDTTSSTTRARLLTQTLAKNPEWRARVSTALNTLVRSVDLATLLTYGGIPRHFHFWGAMKSYLSLRFLPTPCNTTDAEQIVDLALRERDLAWLSSSHFLDLLRDLLDEESREAFRSAAREASVDLAHQLVAQAHTPSFRALRASPRSPFSGLYDAVVNGSAAALMGRITQCEKALEQLRAASAERGAELETSFQLVRMLSQLERLRVLVVATREEAPSIEPVVEQIARACTRRGRGQWLLDRSTSLVVQNIVDTTASVGQHYLDERSAAFRTAFLAGAGGGFLMAIATVMKFVLAGLHAPPIYQGIVFALNYASAFVAAYLLHWTIATKLPSHTAAAIARSIQTTDGYKKRIAQFLAVWRPAVRLQIAGVLGNLVAIVPLVVGADAAYRALGGHHVLDADKAAYVLHAHEIVGPSALYAGVAGCFLWASSMFGASIDNWTRVNALGERFATNLWVMRTIGIDRARAVVDRVVPKLGGLSGNIALGWLLGVVPAIGAILVLPLDIRHVTVSAGSVSLAIATGTASAAQAASAAATVLVIGSVNIAVSFVIALWVTLRSTSNDVRAHSAPMLLRIGLRRWLGQSSTRRRVKRLRTATNSADPTIDQITGKRCPPMETGKISGRPSTPASQVPSSAPMKPSATDPRQPVLE